MNFLKKQTGQSITEVLVGLALLSIIGYVVTGGMSSLRATVSQTVTMSAVDRQVSDIANNIASGVENYQVNFDLSKNIEELLKSENLPMAWGNGLVTTAKECPQCVGKFGYVIQPFEMHRGLYQVTLRLTHKDWLKNGEPYRDYIFVVSAK